MIGACKLGGEGWGLFVSYLLSFADIFSNSILFCIG